MAAIAALLLALLLMVWLARRPIAGSVIDDYFAARRVPARYELVDIGPQDQLLRHVVIGDPAHPDLIARELRLNLGWGLTGVRIEGIRARGLRLRAGLDAKGKLQLGLLDRLLPPPSGKPFALPAYDLDIADSAMELTTPWGKAVAGINGRGPLPGGFNARLVVRSMGMSGRGCTLGRTNAPLILHTDSGRLHIGGLLATPLLGCTTPSLTIADARLRPDIWLAHDVMGWTGSLGVHAAEVRRGADRLDNVAGTLGLNGTADGKLHGQFSLSTARVQFGKGGDIRGQIDLAGDYRISQSQTQLNARLKGRQLVLGPKLIAPAHAMLIGAVGTPVAGMADDLDKALHRAAQSLDLMTEFQVTSAPQARTVKIAKLLLSSASGTQLSANDLGYDLDTGRFSSAPVTLSGGGFPDARLTMTTGAQERIAGGVLTLSPLRHGRERLVLAPIRLAGIGADEIRIDTRFTLDGDFPGGRVEGFTMPLSLRIGQDIRLGQGCMPVRFTRLAAADARFGPHLLRVCPTQGDSLLRAGGRRGMGGGFRIATPMLRGQMGDQALAIAARALTVPLVPLGFRWDDGAITIGSGEDPHRFAFASLNGAFDTTGVAGRFTALSAKLGAVPLRADEGVGTWSFRHRQWDATGDLRVSDAATNDPRFRPLAARQFHLTLRDNVLQAIGTLRHPASGTQVVDVDIRHHLGSGVGHADLDVPGLYFRTDGMQPDMLTSTTLGVIANVRGDVAGKGRIDWTPQGVTSSGTFATHDMDFAAAFGPVTGFSTELAFTDLLGLESATGQQARLRNVNPGMEVLDGLIRYHLLPGKRVEIEGGRWPFNGGWLVLEPTIIDLNAAMARRMTFRIDGLDAARFMDQMGYENISATGIFDGEIPMIFDDRGGRIEGGFLKARDGGGTLAYVGEITRAQLGHFGKLAFDALRSLRYRSLTIELDGALDGEIVTRVKFDGLAQEPITPGAKIPFQRTLKKLPFRFNISIHAPFRGLLNQAELLGDPRKALRTYMPPPMTDIPGVTP